MDDTYIDSADLRRHGIELRENGRLREAAACFERVLALDPRDGAAHRYLVETRSGSDAAHLARMTELAGDPLLREDDRIELHFALAAACEALGRYREAFAHARIANESKRATLDYDPSADATLLRSLRAMFSPQLARAVRGAGEPDAAPVFIIGMPRSGTTLVEQMLAAHPGVYAAGELDAFERALGLFPPIAADPRDTDAFLAELRAALRELGARYLASVQAPAPAQRFTDKMPSNFRFAVAIAAALPNARFVHVLRDPRDTCLSCYMTNFADGQNYAYDLKELGSYYRLYREQMSYVRALLPKGVMLDLEYEALVGDFEAQARRIVEHCGLAWDPACLEFWKVERPIRTASVVQVRRPLSAGSIGRWRHYERELRPLIDALHG
ncbi:MAG TPA: sulfotransferase [Candidatus Acidoferrales bacterium]|nr:sulfotransferase [Candidatus Acidoferrales bacterium]